MSGVRNKSCNTNYGYKMKDDYRFLKETAEPGVFTEWQEVDVEIDAFTNLGIKVIINDEYVGLVY